MIAWKSGPRCRVSRLAPDAATTSRSEPANVPRNQAKPVTVRSIPTRLRGLRDHAISPQAMKAHPTARSLKVIPRLCSERTNHSAARPSRSPEVHSTVRTRARSAPETSGDERRDRTSRQVTLEDEPPSWTSGEASSIRRDVAGGYEHDSWSVRLSSQSLGDLETIDAGQLDVEQHDLGMEEGCGSERGRRILGFADNRETLRLQQGPGERSEASVVVDDQHRKRHQNIVARPRNRSHRGHPLYR